MVTPSSVYEYDLNTQGAEAAQAAGGARRLRPDAVRGEARLGARRATARRCRFRSSTRRASKLDGTAPMLLYAYGSYGASMAPTFSSARLSLLDRGAIYAHRLHPRRRRARRGMARAGADDEEDEHVQRLHRLRRVPGQAASTRRGPAGDPGRQRRRAADGRGVEHAAGSLQGGRRRRCRSSMSSTRCSTRRCR